jgi:hypothetical protein
MCIAAAVAGAGLVGGVVSSNAAKGAAKSQANASDRATQAQAEATQKQIDLQREMFNKQIELQSPFRQSGLNANNRLSALLGLPSAYGTNQTGYGSLMKAFGAEDFQQDPGYQFRMQQGMDAAQNSAAARGGLLSGGALKALEKYGQDFASNEYQNSYNRYNNNQTNQYNRLAGLAGVGQQATNQLGQAAGNFANQGSSAYGNFGNAQAGNIIGAGNAQAAGQVGSANAWNSALGGIGNALQQKSFFDNPSQYSYQGSMLPNSLRGGA